MIVQTAGEMESDTEEQKLQSKSVVSEKVEHKEEVNLNISHEDLSDVSDLDSMDAVDKDVKVIKISLYLKFTYLNIA